jgi:hypothetical protein
MHYYCKLDDDDTIHGPYSWEELKYYISMGKFTKKDWFAKSSEIDAANKTFKIKTWLPEDCIDELHNLFYPPWSYGDILWPTLRSKNVPFWARIVFAISTLALGGFTWITISFLDKHKIFPFNEPKKINIFELNKK